MNNNDLTTEIQNSRLFYLFIDTKSKFNYKFFLTKYTQKYYHYWLFLAHIKNI
jgi:hypothetical protein